MIYQDPLAYLIGLEGVALLDGWAGDHPKEFTEARLAEVRRLLDDAALRERGVHVESVDAATAYRQQAPGYDAGGGGGLFDLDTPLVAEFLAGRPAGVALDAACGTGRFAELLAAAGHQVVGVDVSEDMLAIARRRVPGGTFHIGDLDRLPLADGSVDVVVCALALVHVRDLGPAMAELARVLRPGGDLVVSDIHHELTTRGSAITGLGPAGEPLRAPTYRHPVGDYLRAALAAGLIVRRCEEPGAVVWDGPLPPRSDEVGDWEHWPWSLMSYEPAAIRAAGGRPALLLWHFRQPER
ncbi:MAG: class I SAM-dependent methyltransferase [Promicromonosporaceae bacterium]|nr:class I SAM-dependent methyltransferase [Promicromonosporaceae bacterium]